MAGNERELKLKLTIDVPDHTKPSRAFQSLANDANRASEAVKDFNRQQQRMAPPGMGGAGGGGFGTPPAPGNTTPGGSASSFTGQRLPLPPLPPMPPQFSQPQSQARSAIDVSNRFGQMNQTQLFNEFEKKMQGDRVAWAKAQNPWAASPVQFHQGAGPGPQRVAGTPAVAAAGVPSSGVVWGGATSSVSAMSRPTPVVIMGPVPLNVRVVDGGPAAVAARPAGGAAGGLGVVGALGAVGAVIGGAAATVSALANSVETVAKLHDPLLTTHQRLLAVTSAIPLFGNSLASLTSGIVKTVERLTDWSGSIERDRYRDNFPAMMAADASTAAGAERIAAVRRSSRGYGRDLAALRENPGVGYQVQTTATAMHAAGGGGYMSVGGIALAGGYNALDTRTQDGLEAVQLARRGAASAEAAQQDLAIERIRARGAAFTAEQAFRQAQDHTRAMFEAAGGGRTPQASQQGAPQAPQGRGFWDGARDAAWGARWGGVLGIPGMFVGGVLGAGIGQEKLKDQAGRIIEQAPKDGRYEDAKLRETAANEAYTLALRKATEAQERFGTAAIESLKKQHEVSKALTELSKTRVDLLSEELSRTKQGSREFMAMDSVGQRGFVDAFERFQKGGRDFVSPEEFQQLLGSGITGRKVGDTLEQQGGMNALLKRLLEQVGMRDTEFLENEIRKSKVELAGKIQLDEEQALTVLKKSAEKMNEDLVGLIKKIVFAEAERAWIGRAAGNATMK